MVLSFPPLRFTWRSLKRLLADERAVERDEIRRMVQHSEMPAPQMPHDALRGIGLGDGVTQRCAP